MSGPSSPYWQDDMQGNLFKETFEAHPISQITKQASTSIDLTDEDLLADAAYRPRKLQKKKNKTTTNSPNTGLILLSEIDEPAWAHHSQLDPLQLTPMLRHYV